MKRALVMFARALRRRCPHCGGGPVITRWIHTRPACPRCRLRLDRGEPDYFLGAIVFNMAFAQGLFAAGLVAVLAWTWPNPPWDALYYGGIAGLIVAPILFYPYSKLLWLAFDLLFRPLRPKTSRRRAPRSGAGARAGKPGGGGRRSAAVARARSSRLAP